MSSSHFIADSEPSAAGQFFSACLGQPFLSGNQVTVLHNGDEIFPAMLEAIDQAQHHIEFLTYVYWQGEIAVEFGRRLAAAARRGVTVRVLLDSHGAKDMAQEARDLIEEHCQLHWFRPLHIFRFWQNFKRTHRKIMVCDGQLAFTGGVGIAQQWTGDADSPDNWRELHFSVRGPSVGALRAAFAENWLETGARDDELLNSLAETDQPECGEQSILTLASTASDYWSPIGTLFLTAIAAARKSLWITTPYLVLDKKLQQNLIDTRQRGVDINIIIPTPEHSDSKLAALSAHGCMRHLIENKIKVYSYQPTMIHTKCIIIDQQLAIVGSVNFNQRSQRKDDEISLLLDGGQAVQELIQSFQSDKQHSKAIEASTLRKRSRLLFAAARVIQPFRRNL